MYLPTPIPAVCLPLPKEKTKAEQRRRWVKAINRKDLNSGKNWEPKAHDRICSKHFVDGQPTTNNPYPTLHLGYSSLQQAVATPRRPPIQRPLPPVVKKDALYNLLLYWNLQHL